MVPPNIVISRPTGALLADHDCSCLFFERENSLLVRTSNTAIAASVSTVSSSHTCEATVAIRLRSPKSSIRSIAATRPSRANLASLAG